MKIKTQHYNNNRGTYNKIVSCSINNNVYITIDVDFLSLVCYSVSKLLEKQKKQNDTNQISLHNNNRRKLGGAK